MNISKLPIAIETDLIFARFNGKVLDKSNYMAIKTPSNPSYHWGNYIVFPCSPELGDEARWPSIFRSEFADIPDATHITFTWATPEVGNAIKLFTDLGYAFETNTALAAESVRRPQKFNADVKMRPIRSDAEWEAVVQNQMSANE